MRLVTILFLLRGDEVLLAMKKRRFGEGKWNGVGGKADPGESAEQTAIRECQEEIGVTPSDLRLVGKIKFYEKADPDFGHYAHVFITDKWQGEPTETEEMQPKWFKRSKIPYNDMWAADGLWFPLVLEGKLFETTITFDSWKPHKHDIKLVDKVKAV